MATRVGRVPATAENGRQTSAKLIVEIVADAKGLGGPEASARPCLHIAQIDGIRNLRCLVQNGISLRIT